MNIQQSAMIETPGLASEIQIERNGFHKDPGRMMRPTVDGKFLSVGGERFFVKGVTYGAFAPNSEGHQFPERADVALDFSLMRKAGINSILTYTVPPVSLLDQAEEHGIRVIVNTPWMAYVCFLEEAGFRKQVREEVRAAVSSCQRHPAVLMHCVSKEIPPQIVRWHGAKKVEKFLKELYEVAKDVDPESLVSYTNFPTTEYLDLNFVDVFTFNVYLHQRPDFCAYLSRLQHLAGELPFVMTEFGMCSFRHGQDGQSKFLDWQIEEIFDHGAAGAVAFGWTDPFYQDNSLITDWGFGLVDEHRRPKPSYEVVQRRFTRDVPFPQDRKWPRISVVVAAYNAGRTLEECLSALQNLRYPDYEVIVVNDGSKDATECIMRKFPFHCITTPNQGVSAARNVGLRAATGEIVAYIDSDANADPDWLSYLATTYLKFDIDGVGGPNFVPLEDNWLAKCVYRSPGGPTQVMLNDVHAEHIPGCNMSFRKAALDAIGGFDPIFRAAADDVDICWRLIDDGRQIGFSPSAVVWHHRRPSVKAYWKQQVGYGLSESILERKTPDKFNPWGHTFWSGRIYGPYPFFRLFSQPRVYQGLWGSAPFQSMYDPGGGNVLSFLPRAMEWHVACAFLLVLGIVFPWALVPAGIGIVYTIGYCIVCARQAKLDVLEITDGPSTWQRRLKWRATIAWLNFLEPVARDWGRLKGGLTPWRTVTPESEPQSLPSPWWKKLVPFQRNAQWSSPGTMELEKFSFLNALHRKFTSRGCAVGWNDHFQHWDMRFRRGALGVGKLHMVVEHHGGEKRKARFSLSIAPPATVYWVLAILAVVAAVTGALAYPIATGLLIFAMAVLWFAVPVEANRLESMAVSCAAEAARDLREWMEQQRRAVDKKPVETEGIADEDAKAATAG